MSPTRGDSDGWGRRQGIHSPEDRRFVGLAAAALDDYLARNPVVATMVGDERFDARLPDYTADGVAEQVRVLNRHLLALESIDTLGLSRVNAVDLSILRKRLTSRVYQLRTLDQPTWNPMWWSPGQALEPLFARSQPPVHAILSRLAAIPEHLDSARQSLGAMPRPHLEHALAEVEATPAWLNQATKALAEQAPTLASQLQEAVHEANAALTEYRHFLLSRREGASRDPRLGPRRYAEVLEHLVGTNMPVDVIKREAEEELLALEELMRSAASQVLGRSLASRRLVPTAVAWVGTTYSLPRDGLVEAAARSVVAAREFVIAQRLVSVPAIEVDVVPMPAVRAGRIAVFSEPPGALGTRAQPARVAISGPEPGWTRGRTASFLREYNALMLDALMAHQAFPGHVLQAAHARGVATPTSIRSVFPDQVFSEGWAVHAQDMLVEHGYPGSVDEPAPAAFALQHIKLRQRAVVNALLDIGYHTQQMDEPQARRLLATGAMAEEAEFVVKWRRVQTSSGALTRYFLGHRQVRDLVADVQAQNPDWNQRQVHDRVLMHGAVPPAEARSLLALG